MQATINGQELPRWGFNHEPAIVYSWARGIFSYTDASGPLQMMRQCCLSAMGDKLWVAADHRSWQLEKPNIRRSSKHDFSRYKGGESNADRHWQGLQARAHCPRDGQRSRLSRIAATEMAINGDGGKAGAALVDAGRTAETDILPSAGYTKGRGREMCFGSGPEHLVLGTSVPVILMHNS